MSEYGFSEKDARRFLERELGQNEASTSFYWESEEVEELMELIVDAVAKTIAANNQRLVADWSRENDMQMRVQGL